MASILEVKKKIAGVKNTKKITKAMQLVATAKMKQFQTKAQSTRSYVWDLLQVLEQNISEQSHSIYTEKRKEGKTLFVLYTSDKGLCGALNNNLIKGIFRSEKWENTPKKDRLLITIGKKANEFAKNNDIPVKKAFTGLPEKPETADILPVIDEILAHWNDGSCKEILFVAPHFKNTFTFYPVLKTFLPFSSEMVKTNIGHAEDEIETKSDDNKFMYYEPSQERVTDVLFLQVIQGLFIQSFYELKASEYSSRMIAMQNATDSADNMITDLTRIYNKTRQQVITQQIAELVGASEAMNGQE